MSKMMKLVDEHGNTVKGPREVKSCFVRSYAAQGWVVIPAMAGDKPNPEFMQAYKPSIKPQDGRGADFGPSQVVGTAVTTSDPVEMPAAGAPTETAAQRHARKNGAAPAAEPGKE